jgi:hypothetical protein
VIGIAPHLGFVNDVTVSSAGVIQRPRMVVMTTHVDPDCQVSFDVPWPIPAHWQ